MIRVSVAEVAAVLGADLVRGGPGLSAARVMIADVTADSRRAGPGTLFVALPGERVDGHDYVGSAFAAGAVAALVARPVGAGVELVVDDPLLALGRLARHVVDRGRAHGLRVVGITGSQGKTSTKDLLGAVLADAGPTVAPLGNLNNELGLPLTVTRVQPETRFLVAEMGARGVGHIAYLCRLAPPDVGVVLHVGQAHLSEFGSRAAIARAKGELVEALPPSGTAVLNAHDPLVWAMRLRTRAHVLAFAVGEPPTGPGTQDAVWAEDLSGDERGRYRFDLHARLGGRAGSRPVALTGTGRHHVGNAVAAAGAALALGLGIDAVAGSLSAAKPASRWRMEVSARADGVTVLNDAYNANPDSMAAALATLSELAGHRGTRAWAVLGDMLELGAVAPAEHEALGRAVARAQVGELVALGAFADTLVAAAAPVSGRVAASTDEAVAMLISGLRPGDVVLVKASRGLALDTVAEAILAVAEPRVPGEPTPTGSTPREDGPA